MTHPALVNNARIYAVVKRAPNGRVVMALTRSEHPDMTDALGVLLWRGQIMDGASMEIDISSQPAEDPAVKALQSATLLGLITIAQTATVALAAGLRTVGVSVPASMKMKAGDPIIALPTSRVLGYAIHDAVAVSSTLVSVTMTAPVLALNQSYSLPCKLIRLNL